MSPEEARGLLARMPAARTRWLTETTRTLQAGSVWLAGSLGRGQGDAFSDVDLIVVEGRIPPPGALLTLERADNGPAAGGYVGAMYDLGPLTLWVDCYLWPPDLPVPRDARLLHGDGLQGDLDLRETLDQIGCGVLETPPDPEVFALAMLPLAAKYVARGERPRRSRHGRHARSAGTPRPLERSRHRALAGPRTPGGARSRRRLPPGRRRPASFLRQPTGSPRNASGPDKARHALIPGESPLFCACSVSFPAHRQPALRGTATTGQNPGVLPERPHGGDGSMMVIQTPVSRRVGTTGVASRMVLTALGAAGLIVGAFLKWTRDLEGTHVSWSAFYSSDFGATDTLAKSVGGASILLGLVAVLGLAERSGWLIRLAGAVGIVGVVLFVIQVQSSSDHGMQLGMWFSLVGSILCVAAGLGTSRDAVIVDE